MRLRLPLNLPGLVFTAGLLLAWEETSRWIGSINCPGFLEVVRALWSTWNVLGEQILITLGRAAIGFAAALLVMLPVGIFMGRTPRVLSYVEPVINMLRPLPPLAIVPVVMLFAGTGSTAKISVVFYSAAFPILINAIDATRATPPQLLNVGRSIGLSRTEIMLYIDLPSALPQIMAGLRLGVAVALLVSVSSEMLLSTDGMGNYLMRAQEQFNISGGVAGILVVALASLAINKGMAHLERRLLSWHRTRHQLGSVATAP